MKKLHVEMTPEIKAKLAEHNKKWIANALRTTPMDRDKVTKAIKGMYAAAKLKEPRVIIVPSPMVLAMAGGMAAGILYARKKGWKGLTDAATDDATSVATFTATRGATEAVTHDATLAATDVATRGATSAATDAATRGATDAATRGATRAATSAATYSATSAATDAATRGATDAATRGATRAATSAATYSATRDATDDATNFAMRGTTNRATRNATLNATLNATDGATLEATYTAMRGATNGATNGATLEATYTATNGATNGATLEATRDAMCAMPSDCTLNYLSIAMQYTDDRKLAEWIVGCSRNWWRMYQGGNMWAGYLSYLSAFRDVYGLKPKEYENYQHYEDAAEGGFRIMHEDFCMVCEHPEVLKIDSQNRPHCDDGPSHRWRDGWSLYHIHGVRVKPHVVMHPETITLSEIKNEENAEVRRVLIDQYGPQRYLTDTNAKLLHCDVSHGLPRGLVVDDAGNKWLYGSDNSTGRVYTMPVPREVTTCREAHEAICGFNETTIIHQS